jgi:hypothetical protein
MIQRKQGLDQKFWLCINAREKGTKRILAKQRKPNSKIEFG